MINEQNNNSFIQEYYSGMNDNTYNFCQQTNINPENDDENINEFSNLFLESYKQYDESSIQDDYIIGINIFFLKVIWNFYLFIFIYSFLFIHLLIKNSINRISYYYNTYSIIIFIIINPSTNNKTLSTDL